MVGLPGAGKATRAKELAAGTPMKRLGPPASRTGAGGLGRRTWVVGVYSSVTPRESTSADGPPLRSAYTAPRPATTR